MKKSKVFLYRTLYFTAKLFSWRRLMLFAGASLLAASQACKTSPKMCYEIATPNDSIQSQTKDSLYFQIDCYEIPNFPDTSHLDSKEETPKEID